MKLQIKSFTELTVTELYDALQLRSEIFVVEQNCVYLDPDGKDKKAVHILGYVDNELVAYSRVFEPGIYFSNASIGRVVVKKEHRKDGYGFLLVSKAIEVAKQLHAGPITISAQQYLEKFYQSLGFETVSDMYLEDDIPHIEMLHP
ncbi:GNAT family N-acetyltransferase [Flavobacterium agricola]|uniref:GNAT family N-acetyltransferase n=1 Tax=Flavobacterium agricola TaxID=2870839 RepID=A0ABY6M2B4_9FLAO|nr:GNAT family N-acetyltransferase [Flavobacterium agricola]UYW01028.1 GNAT family N-acetyltransferase [Flavobacterium agricola]